MFIFEIEMSKIKRNVNFSEGIMCKSLIISMFYHYFYFEVYYKVSAGLEKSRLGLLETLFNSTKMKINTYM